jgi:hypothetical protein
MTAFAPSASLALAVGALGVLFALLGLAVAIVAMRRSAKLARHYDALMRDVNGIDLAAAMEAYADRQRKGDARLSAAEARLDDLDAGLRGAVQRVSVSRYKAFEDAGGDQSFTVALMDGHGDGVVLSGLHARGGIRVYAKPLNGGRSTYALTSEEDAAVENAGRNAAPSV